MAKKVLLITLVGLIARLIFWPCFNVPSNLEASITNAVDTAVEAETTAQSDDSCAQPSANNETVCREREQGILSTVVRLELLICVLIDEESGFDMNKTYAHATIKEDRYLVTHNHFDISLDNNGNSGASTLVTIYKADGQVVYRIPLQDLTLVLEAPETLVFDIGEIGRQKLADSGLRSASFKSWSSLTLHPGMEVAQLDWDGDTAHIDWVSIDTVLTDEGTPRLELNNFVRIGASGGPIFWNGFHVANNWARVSNYNATGEVVRAYSVGALNPPSIVEQLSVDKTAEISTLVMTETVALRW